MDVQTFAEKILLATTLEEKLKAPDGGLSFEATSPRSIPGAPGRPEGLEFRKGGSDLSGLSRIETDEDRARLLHYFANHELLAVELMALALLKFPEAPVAFRKGLLRTLKEEQEHTRLYMERMSRLGLAFGDLPVNGFFWKMVSSMETPMDYVSRLSLTFEQANLDYSRFYGSRFREAGDEDTGLLLDRIYKDEISHVGYGLKWFRRWKKEGESDWEAYSRVLSHPLSPRWAKSQPFNEEGRLRSGLDEDFVRRLKLFSRSRGRSPVVHWFNPFAEYHCLEEEFVPKKGQREWEDDLSTLPLFLARNDDAVVLREEPSLDFLERLDELGAELPEMLVVKEVLPSAELLDGRPIGGLRPWAWSPDAVRYMKPLVGDLRGGVQPGAFDVEGFRELFGKAEVGNWCALFEKVSNGDERFATSDDCGVTVRSEKELVEAMESFRNAGVERFCLKANFGFASTGMIRIWNGVPDDSQWSWIRRQLELQSCLRLEPWLERVFDFSVQFELGRDGVRLVGFVEMENDHRGLMKELRVQSPFARDAEEEVRRLLNDRSRGESLSDLYQRFGERAGNQLEGLGYQGAFGVDALVARLSDGELKIRPVVELNPRCTMGRVALELSQLAAPGSCGRLRFFSKRDLGEKGCKDFGELGEKLDEEHPLVWKDVSPRRLASGWVPLNDPEKAKVSLGAFLVG